MEFKMASIGGVEYAQKVPNGAQYANVKYFNVSGMISYNLLRMLKNEEIPISF
jgi:hypothetical protein